MAKKINVENIIEKEIGNFEDKLKEFQSYLKINNIATAVTQDGQITMTDENLGSLHDEILLQIKMQDAVISWLPLLKKLKEVEKDKAPDTYGDAKIGGMFKDK